MHYYDGFALFDVCTKPTIDPKSSPSKISTCISPDCNLNRTAYIDRHNVRYHDCIQIKSTKTDLYNMPTFTQYKHPTLWHRSNDKNVGDLILELFAWKSYRKKNYWGQCQSQQMGSFVLS
jgi:hypothetical protein